MSRVTALACIAMAAAPVAVVDSFTTSSSQAASLSVSGTTTSFPMPAVHSSLFASTTANADGDNNNSSSFVASRALKQLEKKEAKLDKQRAKAMEQLNKLDATLNDIQSKKQEYLNGVELAEPPAGGVFSETTARSAVKAFCWRIIAGSVTFITSLRFSGSIATALTIVGSDFFSKAFTMFIGERLMNKSQAGRKSGADNAGRSLAKALIWRLFAICNTLTMAVFIAKDISIASKIAGSDAIFKTGLMFVYERVWAKIEWGKEYQMEFNI